MPTVTVVAAADPSGLTGVSGFFVSLIDTLGEIGVGLLTFVETVIPPIPSEVVLPLAGFLAQQGRLSLVWLLVTSTLGSVVGAWVFYGIGRSLGLSRSIRMLSKVPLLDVDDLHRASAWFQDHGRASVFFGRFIPGVRSLISLPAGAQRMPILGFTMLTAAGSALWNAALIGAGYVLGTQWATVGSSVSRVSNIVVLVIVVVTVAVLVRRAIGRRGAAGR